MSIKEDIKKEAIGRYTDGRIKKWSLSNTITISGNQILYNDKIAFGTIDEVNRVIAINRRLVLESDGKRNPLLSHTALVPNCTYKIQDGVNEHWFITDELGRTTRTKHWVKAIYHQRLNDEQTKALMCKDEDTKPNTPKEYNDEGGHILADSAGGLPESINIFPQAYRINHSKEWRSLETNIKNAVNNGDKVLVETEFSFSGASKRPKAYNYNVAINGEVNQFSFSNDNNKQGKKDTIKPKNEQVIKNDLKHNTGITASKPVGRAFFEKPMIVTLLAVALLIIAFLLFRSCNKGIKPIENIELQKVHSVNQKKPYKQLPSPSYQFAKGNINESIQNIEGFKRMVQEDSIVPCFAIQFAKNSHKLTQKSILNIKDLISVTSLKKITISYQVDGYTCDLGTEEYNLKLATQRAETVKHELIKHGADRDMIKIKAYGESKFKPGDNIDRSRITHRTVLVSFKDGKQ